MKVAVAAETDAGEPRVAAVPETIKTMIGLANPAFSMPTTLPPAPP
jgi:NAD/NADP transhydrogenase alpha subunit